MFVDSLWVQKMVQWAVSVRVMFHLDQAGNLTIRWNLVLYARLIGVGRFKILGGQGLEFFLGGEGRGGGANSQQAHDVVTTSMRLNDVASTSFWRRVPTRFLIYQCQITTFLILKYDIIENSRIELRGIVLPVQVGGLLGGQRVCCPPPPSQIIAPPPPPPPFLRLWDCLPLLKLGKREMFLKGA